MEKIRWFFLLFYVAFCRADSQLDLYCTDPDTGLRYPVNSTWPSTKFCGTYTCHAKFISVEGEYKEIATITKEYDDNKIVKGSFKDDDSDDNSEANNDDQIESSTEPGEEKDFDVDENDFSDWEKDEFKKLYELYKMASDLSESIKKSESDVKHKKEQFAKNFVSSQIQKMYGKPMNQEFVSNTEQIQENSHNIDKTTNYPFVLFYNQSGQMPPISNNEMSSAIYSDYNKYLAQYYGTYPYSEYEYPHKQEQNIQDIEPSSSSANVVYNYPDNLHYDQQANTVANTYVHKYFEFWNNYYENLLQYNRNQAKKSNDEHQHHHDALHQHHHHALHQHHAYNTNVNPQSYYNQYYHQRQNDEMNRKPMNDQLLQCSDKNEENTHAHDHHHHHHHHNTQENQQNSTHEHNHHADHKQTYSHEHNKYYSNANQNNHTNSYYYYDPVKKEYTPNVPQNFSSYIDYYEDYMSKYGSSSSSSNVNAEIAEDNSDDAAKEYHKNYYSQYYQNSQAPKNEPQISEVKTESFDPQSDPGIPDESKIHQPSYKYKLSTSDLTSTVEQDENWTNFRDPDDTIQWKVNPYTTDGYPSDNKANRGKDLAYSIGSRSTSPHEDNTKFNRINARLNQFGLPSVSKSLRLAKLNPLASSKLKVPSFGTLVKRFAPEEDRKRRSADPKTYITVQGCPEPNEPGKFSCGDKSKRYPKCCPQKILS